MNHDPTINRPRRSWRRWLLFIILAAICLALGDQALILARIFWYRHANPSSTALMEQRAEETSNGSIKREQIWVPYDKMSRNLVRAVLAGEDSRFFDHAGFDWEEIQKAIEQDWEEKEFRRGASTISQQLAKNLFLSTSKNPLRKLHEALITWELERILGKRRILEIYLNIIEWGEGIYGAEAASRHYFGTSAAALGPDQAAFLSAIIPNPRRTYNPAKHPGRVAHRQNLIARLMRHIVVPKDLD